MGIRVFVCVLDPHIHSVNRFERRTCYTIQNGSTPSLYVLIFLVMYIYSVMLLRINVLPHLMHLLTIVSSRLVKHHSNPSLYLSKFVYAPLALGGDIPCILCL